MLSTTPVDHIGLTLDYLLIRSEMCIFSLFFPQGLFVSDLPAQFGIKTTVSGLRSYGY